MARMENENRSDDLGYITTLTTHDNRSFTLLYSPFTLLLLSFYSRAQNTFCNERRGVFLKRILLIAFFRWFFPDFFPLLSLGFPPPQPLSTISSSEITLLSLSVSVWIPLISITFLSSSLSVSIPHSLPPFQIFFPSKKGGFYDQTKLVLFFGSQKTNSNKKTVENEFFA